VYWLGASFSAHGLPDAFTLEIHYRGQLIQVSVKWRKEPAVGVKFAG
jgi:hypothetical protein